MGRVISKVKHPFRDFNLESRAHKVISQSDKKPAPKHAKDTEDLQRIQQSHSASFEESLKKNETLDKYLKDVFVVSHDRPIEQAPRQNPNRPLPQDRKQPELFLFGHKEPDKIPVGKTTLRNVLKFIAKHQEEPHKYTAAYIAEEYKLSPDIVKNILEFYKVFEIYMPPERAPETTRIAGPSNPKVYIINDDPRHLLGQAKKKDKDET